MKKFITITATLLVGWVAGIITLAFTAHEMAADPECLKGEDDDIVYEDDKMRIRQVAKPGSNNCTVAGVYFKNKPEQE